MPKTQKEISQLRRWIIPAIILIIGIAAYIYIWGGEITSRQDQVLQTMVLFLVALLALVLWFSFFSPFPKTFRLTVFSIFLVIAVFSVISFRIRGFSGDVLPVLEWRWSKSAATEFGNVASAPSASNPSATDTKTLNDYPQFFGPNRDGVIDNISLARDWVAHPPQEIWRRSVGAGWSAFAIGGNSAITQEQRGDEEMVVSYDLFSGSIRWSHSDKARYDASFTGAGPHATPTIAANRVYTLGATGLLNCLDFETGRKIWSKHILHDNDARMNEYGISNSPLVVDSLVVVSAGGQNAHSLVAYHTESGEKVWGADGVAYSAYSSPFLATIAGQEQIIIFNTSQITAHNPQTGRILWKEPWPKETQAISKPVPLPGDRLFVSSGYGIGSKLFHITKSNRAEFRVKQIWKSPRMKAKLSNVVHKDGYIYGLDDGVFVCLDLETGQRKWKRGRYGHGQILLVGDLILVQTEQGEIVLLAANPEKHEELARLSALNGKTWNHLAFAAPYLLVRNDKEAVCYELALASR